MLQSCPTLCNPTDGSPPLPCPWNSPGKNTGVGCHFLLQCMKVKSESEVTQSCPTLRDPMDCSLSASSVHGIFQARVLEWGAIAFSERPKHKSKTIKLFMRKNIYEKLHNTVHDFLDISWAIKVKTDTFELWQNLKLLCIKGYNQASEKATYKLENKFAKHISRIYEEFLQFKNKKQVGWSQHRQRTRINISPKKIHKWPVNNQKDVQPC